MKLAFVYDAVYPWEKGGAQKRVWELARRLATDHEVHLYGMHYWDGPRVIEREGVTLHGVCPPHRLYTDGRRSIPQALRFAAAVTGPLFRERFDVIDCQQFPYFPVFPAKAHALARRSALVVTWYEVWDDYWFEYLGWKGAFGWAVERAVARLPGTVVPISTHIGDELATIGRTTGLSVVENGVDVERLRAIPAAEESWDVVYVGRLAAHKNVDVLLEALATVRESAGTVSACLVGDGPERERLERQARTLGLADCVTFTGFVERDEDVIARLKAGRVFVLPSEREGFPNTILEANACGVPSIVADHPENGGRAVVVDGETGLVTDPGPAALAAGIERVLTDETLRDRLSAGATEFGAAHDWSRIVAELEAVYRSAR